MPSSSFVERTSPPVVAAAASYGDATISQKSTPEHVATERQVDNRPQNRPRQVEPEEGSSGGGNRERATGESGTPLNALVLQQLDRVLRSKTFVQSEKLSRFLRFVVEHVLDGNQSCLKEYLVGVEVYDRRPPYVPSQDSIVRTEARRLRNKLKEYYGAEGKNDPVYIYLRPGSYIPAFQCREDLIGTKQESAASTSLPDKSSVATVAVLPFLDVSGNAVSGAYARGIPDELAYALMLDERCTVVSPSSMALVNTLGLDLVATIQKVSAHVAFEGSIKVVGSSLRVTARLVDAAGAQLWVKRIDTEIGDSSSLAVEEQVAHALAAGLHVVRASALV